MTAAASQAARRRCRRCRRRLKGRALNDLLQTVPGWNEITQQFRQQSSKVKVHSNEVNLAESIMKIFEASADSCEASFYALRAFLWSFDRP